MRVEWKLRVDLRSWRSLNSRTILAVVRPISCLSTTCLSQLDFLSLSIDSRALYFRPIFSTFSLASSPNLSFISVFCFLYTLLTTDNVFAFRTGNRESLSGSFHFMCRTFLWIYDFIALEYVHQAETYPKDRKVRWFISSCEMQF